MWFHEMLQRPLARITTAPIYFTRGYAFHAYEYGKHRTSVNYGVCVRGDVDFYGIIQEIIEITFPGLLMLKCVLFKCEWFDPTVGRGVRINKSGNVDVNKGRRYNKFEPFILASQAEQVSFIPYPRLKSTGVNWLAVVKIAPRGYIVREEESALQHDTAVDIPSPELSTDMFLLIDPNNREAEEVNDEDDPEEEDEFVESDTENEEENVSDEDSE